MEWFKGKTKEIIALVTIVSTLAGFGYAGAGYVNRLENLEAKIGGIASQREGLQNIEERFEGIETSIEYINKSIDSENTGLVAKIDGNDDSISSLKAQFEGLSVAVRAIEKDVDKLEDADSNPLLN